MRRLFGQFLLFFLAFCRLAQGEEGIPELPSSRVVDFGDVFTQDPSSLETLETRLNQLYERYQYSVYFVIYEGIIGSNVSERAYDLRDQWLADGVEGLVFVSDTDLGKVGFALTKAFSQEDPEQTDVWLIEDHHVLNVIDRVLGRSSEYTQESESKHMCEMGLSLVGALEERLRDNERPPRGASPYYLLAFALAGLAMLGVWMLASRGNQRRALIELPEFEMSSRLGAQYGGGVVGEICYVPKSPN